MFALEGTTGGRALGNVAGFGLTGATTVATFASHGPIENGCCQVARAFLDGEEGGGTLAPLLLGTEKGGWLATRALLGAEKAGWPGAPALRGAEKEGCHRSPALLDGEEDGWPVAFAFLGAAEVPDTLHGQMHRQGLGELE